LPTAAVCTPPGLELTGWNTVGDGSGVAYLFPLNPDVHVAMDDEQDWITVYAVWKAKKK
jgi:hypothetical protein